MTTRENSLYFSGGLYYASFCAWSLCGPCGGCPSDARVFAAQSYGCRAASRSDWQCYEAAKPSSENHRSKGTDHKQAQLRPRDFEVVSSLPLPTATNPAW